MTKTIFTFLIFGFQLAFGQSNSSKADNLQKLDWLSGEWTRTNTKPGRNAFETWTKSGNEWRGRGVTMQGSDTVFIEKLSIVVKENQLFYVADVPGNKEPVYFKFTELSEKGFMCENPEHDFPKRISYTVDGDKLKATISGNGKSTDYNFVRKGQ